MKDVCLVLPSKDYEKSFQEYAISYKNAENNYYFEKYMKAIENFHEYLEELYKLSEGIDVPEDSVRTTNYWLVDNNNVVGVVRVRHEEIEGAGHIGYDISPRYRNKGYGTEILRQAISKAKEIGIEEPIVTCNIYNLASKRIIEKNNGLLLGVIFDEEENEELYEYKILASNE
ncbi:GNAT family N-acetyltransferase [Clostridium folliculivorans]|uniref:Acetyltransferase n=1 Tax=Clostridium folliculivorans TaxID=2886038 RepID=A0A9W5Y240_9CLOT|nr:GNAT family N-acetyltransferase [Clostridium folliculivorans]GKU25326.1 acetyltransferase [Clostridium folliculivorans]GKU28347.1 acetyltransferase [Clostridium folliculivorans]